LEVRRRRRAGTANIVDGAISNCRAAAAPRGNGLLPWSLPLGHRQIAREASKN